jgi:hypothetical protein
MRSVWTMRATDLSLNKPEHHEASTVYLLSGTIRIETEMEDPERFVEAYRAGTSWRFLNGQWRFRWPIGL